MVPERVTPNLQEIQQALKIAEEHLQSAQVLHNEGLYRDAISRAYYAFLIAASAALLSKGFFAKTHAGVLTLFGQYFVKPGVLEVKFARFFREVKNAREEADYEWMKEFSQKDAERAIITAKEFLKAIVHYIELQS